MLFAPSCRRLFLLLPLAAAIAAATMDSPVLGLPFARAESTHEGAELGLVMLAGGRPRFDFFGAGRSSSSHESRLDVEGGRGLTDSSFLMTCPFV